VERFGRFYIPKLGLLPSLPGREELFGEKALLFFPGLDFGRFGTLKGLVNLGLA